MEKPYHHCRLARKIFELHANELFSKGYHIDSLFIEINNCIMSNVPIENFEAHLFLLEYNCNNSPFELGDVRGLILEFIVVNLPNNLENFTRVYNYLCGSITINKVLLRHLYSEKMKSHWSSLTLEQTQEIEKKAQKGIAIDLLSSKFNN